MRRPAQAADPRPKQYCHTLSSADPDTIYRDAGVVTTPDHADFTLGSPEENDGSSQGIIIVFTPGDGQKGETVGVIAIISPAENNYQGRSVLEFSVENYPNDSGDEHADLLFSADDPSGAGCSDFICGSNTPVLDGASHLSLSTISSFDLSAL